MHTIVVMKLLAGRPRDTDDAAKIVLRQGTALDWEYLLQTCEDPQRAVDQDIVPQLLRLRQGH